MTALSPIPRAATHFDRANPATNAESPSQPSPAGSPPPGQRGTQSDADWREWLGQRLPEVNLAIRLREERERAARAAFDADVPAEEAHRDLRGLQSGEVLSRWLGKDWLDRYDVVIVAFGIITLVGIVAHAWNATCAGCW